MESAALLLSSAAVSAIVAAHVQHNAKWLHGPTSVSRLCSQHTLHWSSSLVLGVGS